MSELYLLRRQASDLRKQGELKKALSLFRRIWHEYPEERSAWDAWGYAWCYYRLGEFALALSILHEGRQQDPELPALKSLEAWCWYKQTFGFEQNANAKLKSSSSELEQKALRILSLSQADDSMSPYLRTVFKMLEYYQDPWQAEGSKSWLERLNPDALSQESEVIKLKSSQGQNSRTQRLPSNWLRYQARLSEYLLRTAQYEACLACCQQVLIAPASHVSRQQRIWFLRRQGRCLIALKQLDSAIAVYWDILDIKTDWFLYKELAEILWQADQFEEALKMAQQAATEPGELSKKLNLWMLLADCYHQAGQAELAQNCRLLALQIRREQGWTIPENLQALHQRFVQLESSQVLWRKLQAEWPTMPKQSSKVSSTKKHALSKAQSQTAQGKITKILPHGQAGFIHLKQGKHVYFKLCDFKGEQAVQEGMLITCELREGFDPKKQKPSLQAINIYPLEPA